MAGPPKRSKEQNDLEEQLRTMILGNVRIAPDDNRSNGSSARGQSRNFRSHQSRQSGNRLPTGQQPNLPNGPNSEPRAISANQNVQTPNGQHSSGHGNFQTGQFSRGHGRRGGFGGRSFSGHSNQPSLSNAQFGNGQSSYGSRQTQSTAPLDMSVLITQAELMERLAAEEIPAVEMYREEFDEKMAFCQRLELICQQEIRTSFPELPALLYLRTYGSIVSGFATKGSDVDLTIQWSGPEPSDLQFKAWLPRVVEKAILKAGHGARLLSRTRVPIIKICQSPNEELFSALNKERETWEELPEDEKYPSLAPQKLESPIEDTRLDHDLDKGDERPEIDPDVSRNGRKMETHKRVSMQDDPKAFLEQLKSTKRTEGDDLKGYSTQFINARRFALQKDGDDEKNAQSYLDGFPKSVSDEILLVHAMKVQELDQQSIGTTPCLFDLYYEISQPIIARLAQNKKTRLWIREKPLGKLDYPKSGVGIQCDINFSNPLGIHNTELLRMYSLCDARVRPMILFVKAWTKRRKINSAYNGTLSSYGYVLMVLHFLMNVVQPPVLPNLQHVYGSNEQEVLVDGFNASFFHDEQHIRHMAATHQWTPNTDTLGMLLRGFIQYYAEQGYRVPMGGFNWMKDVLSIRTPRGILSKEYKGWTGARTDTVDNREIRQRYLLAIEDPFETSHNVGRPVTHKGIVTIRDEFRRAWRILLAVGRGKEPEGGLFDLLVEAEAEEAETPKAEQAVNVTRETI